MNITVYKCIYYLQCFLLIVILVFSFNGKNFKKNIGCDVINKDRIQSADVNKLKQYYNDNECQHSTRFFSVENIFNDYQYVFCLKHYYSQSVNKIHVLTIFIELNKSHPTGKYLHFNKNKTNTISTFNIVISLNKETPNNIPYFF